MSSHYISAPLPNTAAPSAGVGLGYGIAIAVGILVLVSTILLASYLCVRAKGGDNRPTDQSHSPPSTASSPPLPATVIALGLDEPTINSYPKFVYNGGGPNPEPCPICLSEYRRGEAIRAMPECAHRFHADCVDEWLRVSATCPLCRSSPVPSAAATPLATPLSELVPLALHARNVDCASLGSCRCESSWRIT